MPSASLTGGLPAELAFGGYIDQRRPRNTIGRHGDRACTAMSRAILSHLPLRNSERVFFFFCMHMLQPVAVQVWCGHTTCKVLLRGSSLPTGMQLARAPLGQPCSHELVMAMGGKKDKEPNSARPEVAPRAAEAEHRIFAARDPRCSWAWWRGERNEAHG